MISIEQLIQRLEALHEENNDQALEVSIDIFNRLRLFMGISQMTCGAI